MSDTNATLPPELQSKLEEGVLIAFEKHREEVRRSFEISRSYERQNGGGKDEKQKTFFNFPTATTTGLNC